MSARDERYRQQRDRYRFALVEVAAVAIIGGMTVTMEFLPVEPRLLDDVHRRVRELRAEVDRLAYQQA
ncbi:hypothetical protein RKE38_16315 [Phycicoccus sp. M110.8]|uniref:hypothetical protein n=1 Tax=Phycicoccus sp. M110.8 TaxID=3075433 RepID=UPI0028FD7A0A|nr:hypothetical protein [Phycicoccus sp. M110.8]MDU0315265.1 hypothetical protein [Phycicoccus sp. M110.8]